jgi:hypothetical protein
MRDAGFALTVRATGLRAGAVFRAGDAALLGRLAAAAREVLLCAFACCLLAWAFGAALAVRFAAAFGDGFVAGFAGLALAAFGVPLWVSEGILRAFAGAAAFFGLGTPGRVAALGAFWSCGRAAAVGAETRGVWAELPLRATRAAAPGAGDEVARGGEGSGAVRAAGGGGFG